MTEEKQDLAGVVYDKLDKLNDEIWELAKSDAEYLALLMTISQTILVEVIVKSAEMSGRPVAEAIEHYTSSMKANVEKFFREDKDAKE